MSRWGAPYSADELAILLADRKAGIRVSETAKKLPGRTLASVQQRSSKLGLRRGITGAPRYAWDDQTLAKARVLVAEHGLTEAARHLGKKRATLAAALWRAAEKGR